MVLGYGRQWREKAEMSQICQVQHCPFHWSGTVHVYSYLDEAFKSREQVY